METTKSPTDLALERFSTHFPGRSRVFLPVIHFATEEDWFRSIEVAISAGADGVFLINQGIDTASLLELAADLSSRHRDLWVGVNLLGQTPVEVLHTIQGTAIRGIWADDAFVHEKAAIQPDAEFFVQTRKRLGWDGLYFGGVAFKYVHHVRNDDLPTAARLARAYMDVITTSGPGTGHAASVDKVKRMRSGAGNHPLGLASGVTPENVDGYLPLVQAYLVATGIERDFGVLDEEQTRRLASKIHGA